MECVYSRQGACRPLMDDTQADYVVGVVLDGEIAGDALVPVFDGHLEHWHRDFHSRLDFLDVLDGADDVDGQGQPTEGSAGPG